MKWIIDETINCFDIPKPNMPVLVFTNSTNLSLLIDDVTNYKCLRDWLASGHEYLGHGVILEVQYPSGKNKSEDDPTTVTFAWAKLNRGKGIDEQR